jgi:hypothetical protein
MQLTTNTRAFIESEVISDFILTNLHDGLLGEQFYRNVSDFANGDQLNIKTIGTVAIQEAQENVPLVYSPIETGQVTFRITEYKGDAWYVTDDLREDGNQVDALLAARAAESTRAIQETFETSFFQTALDYYVANPGANSVNGFNHLVVVPTPFKFTLAHMIGMRLAFDKANAPAEGRVFFCDPVVEATFNGLVTVTSDVTPYAVDIVTNGMARGMRFIHKLYGWDIVVSNRLPKLTATLAGVSAVTGNTTSTGQIGDVANLFMCVSDDNCKPIMGAWRRMPKSEGERNKDLARDEHVVRCRYGFGIQRVDTLAALITSSTAY